MKLHQLSSIQEKRHKRIGRSGKRGSYSGRGVKGQKSRSGRRLRPAERDLILRLPKMRGYANLRKSDPAIVFNLTDFATRLKPLVKGKEAVVINKEVLAAMGLLQNSFRGEVKLLGNGEIAFALNISGIKVSESAKKKVQKAGGSVSAAQ